MNVEDGAWLCHDDLKVLLDFQNKLSNRIRDQNKDNFDFVVDYVQDRSTRIPGIATLTHNYIEFSAMNRRLFQIPYEQIQPYSISLFNKEELNWLGPEPYKPESDRCLKFQRKGDLYENRPDYLCVYYQRHDIAMMEDLSLSQARYQADMYANKINYHLQNIALNGAINQLSRIKNPLSDVEDSLLNPVKNQIRMDYYITRYKLASLVKTAQLKRDQFEEKVAKMLEKIIHSVCSGLESCIKAIEYLKDKGQLPLLGNRDKISADLQNPFHSLAPKTKIRLNLQRGGEIGKKLLLQVALMNSGKLTSSQWIPESSPGELPNVTSIKKAFNTISNLRMDRAYLRVEELGQSCRIGAKKDSNNLKRKIAILTFLGTHDTFFGYLANIRDVQAGKSQLSKRYNNNSKYAFSNK